MKLECDDVKKIKRLKQQAGGVKIDKSKGSLFNTWRSIVYNKKGKLIGFPTKRKENKNEILYITRVMPIEYSDKEGDRQQSDGSGEKESCGIS